MSATTNGRALTVQQAEIHTATVSIRTLTINRKQMTLATFRQLLEADLISGRTGEFRGSPWGVVNYCPDKTKCARFDQCEHLHVIWQFGDDLLRATIAHPEWYEIVCRRHPPIDALWQRWADLKDLPQLFIAT
jgi:hypothetical protein